jgi:hypothetical protein
MVAIHRKGTAKGQNVQEGLGTTQPSKVSDVNKGDSERTLGVTTSKTQEQCWFCKHVD